MTNLKKIKKVSIFNNYSPNHQFKRNKVNHLLKQHGFSPMPKGDLILVLGGDGTFLSAIKEKWKENALFALINNGNLGFFSEFHYDNAQDFIKKLKHEEYFVEEYPLYDLEIHYTNGRIVKDVFVNEITIKQQASKVIHLDLILNHGKPMPIYGDGVVISSYLGSTAYNYSLGGSVLMDKLPSFQVTPMASIHNKSYNGLTNSLLLTDKNIIDIRPNVQYKKKSKFFIVADNKEYFFRNSEIQKIRIVNRNKKFRVIRTKDFNHKENIRDKIFTF